MIHIKRNICLVAVSCTLLAGIPLQGVAQTGRTAKVQATQSNKITVSGTVLDKTTNDPLIGVSVVVKGVANAGTITDMDGKFTLKLPYAEAPLVFSYLGYQPQEIVPGAKKELTVLLQEDTKALQEVVVVGYTKQRKETMIGSVATITTKDLTQSPTANINNALAGRLPGLIVNQYAGGEPGVDQSELFIRGKATYGNQSAIVIVDGIERDMSYLAPDEIETFTILKDASATAAYGIRGANGVIVITTKRGKAAEKATVNLKASIGINQPIGFPEYLGSADYATLYNEARFPTPFSTNSCAAMPIRRSPAKRCAPPGWWSWRVKCVRTCRAWRAASSTASDIRRASTSSTAIRAVSCRPSTSSRPTSTRASCVPPRKTRAPATRASCSAMPATKPAR